MEFCSLVNLERCTPVRSATEKGAHVTEAVWVGHVVKALLHLWVSSTGWEAFSLDSSCWEWWTQCKSDTSYQGAQEGRPRRGGAVEEALLGNEVLVGVHHVLHVLFVHQGTVEVGVGRAGQVHSLIPLRQSR